MSSPRTEVRRHASLRRKWRLIAAGTGVGMTFVATAIFHPRQDVTYRRESGHNDVHVQFDGRRQSGMDLTVQTWMGMSSIRKSN